MYHYKYIHTYINISILSFYCQDINVHRSTWAEGHIGTQTRLKFTGDALGRNFGTCAAVPIRPTHPWQHRSIGGWMSPKSQISSPCMRRMLSKTAEGLARRRRNTSIGIIPTLVRYHVLKQLSSAQVFQPRSPIKKVDRCVNV